MCDVRRSSVRPNTAEIGTILPKERTKQRESVARILRLQQRYASRRPQPNNNENDDEACCVRLPSCLCGCVCAVLEQRYVDFPSTGRTHRLVWSGTKYHHHPLSSCGSLVHDLQVAIVFSCTKAANRTRDLVRLPTRRCRMLLSNTTRTMIPTLRMPARQSKNSHARTHAHTLDFATVTITTMMMLI